VRGRRARVVAVGDEHAIRDGRQREEHALALLAGKRIGPRDDQCAGVEDAKRRPRGDERFTFGLGNRFRLRRRDGTRPERRTGSDR
jgi:hypothetical protein